MQTNRTFHVAPRRHALTVAIGFALASGVVHADDFEITTADDSGPGSLRQAIEDANAIDGPHTITFAPGLAGETISLESPLPTIEEDLSLQGSEVTLSGAGEHACLSFNSVDLEIDGLTIRDCYSVYGAAVYGTGGNLVVRNATLTNNSAYYDGGAIEMFEGYSLLIEDSVIANNSSDGVGGGVAATAVNDTTIVGSTISDNSAIDNGGGVAVKYGYEASIVDSTISGNDAGGNGGGLALDTAFGAQLDAVEVSANSADFGGGVFARGNLHLHSGSVIENNTATEGGGLAVLGSYGGGPTPQVDGRGLAAPGVVIEDVTIAGNSAEFGGGLFHVSGFGGERGVIPPGDDAPLEIRNSAITGNTADAAGGMVHYGSGSEASITDTLIADNSALEVGGLAVVSTGSNITVSSSTISANDGGQFGGGAALFSTNDQVLLINSTISGNTAEAAAGMAIFGSPDGVTGLLGTTITGNSATNGRGGGVAAESQDTYGMTLSIANSIIAGNTATEDSPDLSGDLGEDGPGPVGQVVFDRLMDRIRARFAGAEPAAEHPRGGPGPEETVFDVSFSLIGSAPDTGLFEPDVASADVLGEDPELGGLADNGGATPTHLPAVSSPVIDLVTPGESGCDNGFDVDQRGLPRPAPDSSGCDAGSVEVQEVAEPGIGLAPDLDFGDVLVGETAGPLDMTLSSEGDAALVVEAISGADVPFALDFSDCAAELPFELDPGESCALSVTFSPAERDEFNDAIAVTSNATAEPTTASLTGIGVAPLISVGPDAAFGAVSVGAIGGPLTVNLVNDGDADLEVSAIDNVSAPFAVDLADCGGDLPFTLAPGAACELSATFSPDSAGSFEQTATVVSDALAGDDSFVLGGEGVDGDLVLNPTAGLFGDVEVGASEALELTLTNDGDGDVSIDDIVAPDAPFSLTGGTCADVPFVLASGESCTLLFGFSPTAEGEFQDSAQILAAGAEPISFPLSGTGVSDPGDTVEAIPVPTLNRIGLIIGGGLLALMGLFGLRRRRI